MSSLSTPLNALYLAGGPTPQGSLRRLCHYRDKQLIQEVDVYLLFHGVRSEVKRLEPGVVIQVPPLGPEVAIEGMVRRPAIYELRGEKNLAEALELAGSVLNSGMLRHVDVERIVAHENRTMVRMELPEDSNQDTISKQLEAFTIQDGDNIKISPILPYANKAVYLDGHVFRPGKFAYREGMKVGDLIKSYNDLLPDSFLDVDLHEMHRFHMTHRALATVAVAHQPQAERYGTVEMNQQGEIVAFHEKDARTQPNLHCSGLINGGVYLLRRKLLDLIPRGRAVSLEKEVFPSLAGTHLRGFVTSTYFIDIGIPADLERAQSELPRRFSS